MSTRLLTILLLAFFSASVTGAEIEDESEQGTPQKTRAAMPLDQAVQALPSYKFGQSRACCTAISDALRSAYGKPEHAALVARLVPLLDAPGTTDDAKAFILRELRLAGSDLAVPSLSKLLADRTHAHLARAALEQAGTPLADEALRGALSTVKGEPLVGIIISVGQRRDALAVPSLVAFLRDGDDATRAAAAAALGKIGNVPASVGLLAAQASASDALKPAITDACLACGERLLDDKQAPAAQVVYMKIYADASVPAAQRAALRGLVHSGAPNAVPLVIQAMQSKDPAWQVAGAQCVRNIPAEQAAGFLAVLPTLPPDAQALVLSSLASARVRPALPEAIKLASSPAANVRIAAIEAIGMLGGPPEVEMLLKAAAAKGPEQEAARAALNRIGGEQSNNALVIATASGTPAMKVEAIRGLAARGAKNAVPAILAAASGEDATVRTQAFTALASLADANHAPMLVALLPKVKEPQERLAAEDAIVAACRRAGDNRDLAAAPVLAALPLATDADMRSSLLKILARLQGDKALGALRSATQDANAEISDTAVRAMAEAREQSLAPDLLKIAAEGASPRHRILALRGYLDLAADKSLKNDERARRYAAAAPLATRPDEKRLILSGLSSLSTADSLKLAATFLEDPALGQEAALAAVNIAKGMKSDKALVKETMARVEAIAKNPKLKAEAAKLAQ